MSELMASILDIDQSSAILHISPRVLAQKAREGEVPAGKIGRHWLFVDEDLVAFVRSRYSGKRQDAEVRKKEVHKVWHSAKEVTSGTLISTPQMEKEYNAALGLQEKKQPKNTMIG